MKNIYIVLSIVLLATTPSVAHTPIKMVLRDFATLCGTWKGALTYLDYTSGKPYTMPANISVSRIDNSNRFVVSMMYPNESNANVTDTLVVANNGTYVDGARVRSRHVLSNGDVTIVTEEMGKDGNEGKAALFKHTYTIGKTTYTKRKDVRFVGTSEWIKRHEYSFTKQETTK